VKGRRGCPALRYIAVQVRGLSQQAVQLHGGRGSPPRWVGRSHTSTSNVQVAKYGPAVITEALADGTPRDGLAQSGVRTCHSWSLLAEQLAPG